MYSSTTDLQSVVFDVSCIGRGMILRGIAILFRICFEYRSRIDFESSNLLYALYIGQ